MKTLIGIDAGDLPEWISGWSQRLLKPEDFHAVLPGLLAEIGEIVGADRSFLLGKNETSGHFELVSEWGGPGFEKLAPEIQVLTQNGLPYLERWLRKSRLISLTSPNALPKDAVCERNFLSKLGVETIFAVPISTDGSVTGCLGIEGARGGLEWDSATATLLSMIAGILSAALSQRLLSLQEDRLHSFLEAAEDFVGIADPDTLEILFLNQAGRELIGLGHDAPLDGLTVNQITPGSQMKTKSETIFPTLKRKGSWHGEMVIQPLGGEEKIPVFQTIVRVPYSGAPSNFGLGTIIRDLRQEKAAEEKVIKSERLLRNLIATAPHALYLLNYEDGRLEIGEENFAQMAGYTAEELRGHPGGVYGPIHPDDLAAVEAQEQTLAKSEEGKVVSTEFRFRRKDGHWDWIEVHSRVFERDESGKPIREVGMAQTITQRKLAEEQLRRSEERIEMAVRGTLEGLWDSDLTTGKDWWSNRLYEMMGLETGEIEARYENFVNLLHPLDRQRVRDHLDSHLENGTTYSIEYRLRLKSGSYIWVRGRGEAVTDMNGIPIRMAGSVENIERRKHTELRLHREAEINRVILHVMSGFAFVLDAEGKTVQWNRAASELTGLEAQDFEEMPLPELLFPPKSRQRAEMLNEIEQVRAGVKFFHGLRKIWRKSGSTRTVEYACSGIYADDGSLLNIVLVGFDLSPHQRMQREVIRMVEHEQIRIGADLHDGVGQVLTGVSDLSEALAGRLRDPVSREAAGKISQQVRNTISEIRRMSHGLTATSIEKHGLAGSLKVLAESVKDQSGIKCNVTIEQLDEVRDVELVTHLFRIAQEAVNNAVKHSGCNEITISLRETEKETILVIEDNGVGIESKNQSGERGVGLTVMDYRINLMGGSVVVGDRPEGGTRVECRLWVDFDRLDRLKSGKVFLYKPKLQDLQEGGTVERTAKTFDNR